MPQNPHPVVVWSADDEHSATCLAELTCLAVRQQLRLLPDVALDVLHRARQQAYVLGHVGRHRDAVRAREEDAALLVPRVVVGLVLNQLFKYYKFQFNQ